MSGRDEPILLYHANRGTVEQLPYTFSGGFSPDYQWVWMYGGDPSNDVWIRAVDDEEGEWQLWAEDVAYTSWHPDTSALITLQEDTLVWQTFPDGALLGEWPAAYGPFERGSIVA